MTTVLTNGVFDILHRGHTEYLTAAKALGDHLTVAINSDESAARLKPGRPFNKAEDRAAILLALESVDAVLIFGEDTAESIVRATLPDIYVKGGDYDMSQIPEAKAVLEYGGIVQAIPYKAGYSTTALINRIRA